MTRWRYWILLMAAGWAIMCDANATDYERARSLGLALGKNQYSDEVKHYLASVDAAFDKHDYQAFGALMRSPGDGPRVLASLDWAQANMIMGAGVIVPIIYAESLWSIGSSAPEGSPYVNFKDTAAMMTLYSLAVIAVDGPECADQTAPSGHFPKTLGHFKPTLEFLRTLPENKKKQIVDIALDNEVKIAPLRAADNYLCRFGMEEITEGLKGKKLEDLPQRAPQGNEVGTQVSVPSPPNYQPKFLDEAVWRPKQVEMRQKLPDLFAQILKPPSGAK